MALHDDQRFIAGLFAVCFGLLSPIIAENLLATRLSMEGPPVFYGFLVLAGVATAVAVWYSSMYTWKYILLYGVLSVGSALTMFIYMFSQTQA